jgi:hypothetical protein
MEGESTRAVDESEETPTALDIPDEVENRHETNKHLNIVLKALRDRRIVLHQFPASYVQRFVETIVGRLEKAEKRGDDKYVIAYGKLLGVVQQENRKTVAMIDTANRLDEGRPTSIIANPTPELLAKIDRIASGRRDAKRVQNLAAREQQASAPAAGPLDDIVAKVTEGNPDAV